MRRLVVLVTVVLVMMAMLVASAAPALAFVIPGLGGRTDSKCCRVSPPAACNTVAGVGDFQWRAGGTVCWLEAPGWEVIQDLEAG